MKTLHASFLCLGMLCLSLSGCFSHPTATPSDFDSRASLDTPRAVTHKVVRGETLMSISRKYTGSSKNWQKIAAANNMKPNKLRAGDNLIIPSMLASAAVKPAHSNQLAMLSEADLLPDRAAAPRDKAQPPAKQRAESSKITAGKKAAEREAKTTAEKVPGKLAKADKPSAKNRTSEQAKAPERAREVVIFDPIPEEQVAEIPPPVKKSVPAPEAVAKSVTPPAPMPDQKAQAASKVKAVETAVAAAEKPRRESRAMLDPDPVTTVEKPAVFRKAGQKKEVPQNTRSNFYSCIADKCSYHTN